MGIEPTSEAWEAPVLPLNYARSRANELIVHNKETQRTERLNVVMPLFRDLARDWPQNSHGPRDPRRTLVNSGAVRILSKNGSKSGAG